MTVKTTGRVEGGCDDTCTEQRMFLLTVTRDPENTTDDTLASSTHTDIHCHSLAEMMAVGEALHDILGEVTKAIREAGAYAALRELRDILVDGFPDGAE